MFAQVIAHARRHVVRIDEVERQEPALVLEFGRALDVFIGTAGLIEFAALAIDEDRVGPDR